MKKATEKFDKISLEDCFVFCSGILLQKSLILIITRYTRRGIRLKIYNKIISDFIAKNKSTYDKLNIKVFVLF
jgi:hypothetical protein